MAASQYDTLPEDHPLPWDSFYQFWKGLGGVTEDQQAAVQAQFPDVIRDLVDEAKRKEFALTLETYGEANDGSKTISKRTAHKVTNCIHSQVYDKASLKRTT